MAGLALLPNETVIHPQPFVPTDPYRLIITTQRVIHIDSRRVEIPAKEITFTNRSEDRPYLKHCIFLGVIGLPLFIIGLVFFLQTHSINTKVPDLTKEQKNSVVLVQRHQAAVDAAGVVKTKYWEGVVLLLLGAGAGLLIKKLSKKAFYVIASAGKGKVAKIKCKNDAEQNQTLTMVQSAVSAAKMLAAMPIAPAAPPAKR